jgi:hypothetical protein
MFFLVVKHYKKSNKVYRTFMDEVVLLVAKGLFSQNIVENLWMMWFGF